MNDATCNPICILRNNHHREYVHSCTYKIIAPRHIMSTVTSVALITMLTKISNDPHDHRTLVTLQKWEKAEGLHVMYVTLMRCKVMLIKET